MDHSSIVEPTPAPAAAQPALRFPSEDGGRSLAAIACRDLDAALQLLAERAQYITGASGAMIALRRGDHNDMLCRATTGTHAPELGALFSMEYGFSGESVRTRQLLRCDDAERDSRVNREGCRQLGIASVVVSPVLSDQQVLGVFELFSGKPHAFDDHALSALRRLSEMVETAVKYAVAAQTVSQIQEQAAAEEILPPMDEIKIEVEAESDTILATDDLPAAPAVKEASSSPEPTASATPVSKETAPEKPAPEKPEPLLAQTPAIEPAKPELNSEPQPAPESKKPLFWSAAVEAPADASPASESAPVPVGLRNLQKCQACGFPVSQGRTYCVECEEKQWRGQRLPQPASQPQPHAPVISRATEPPPQISSAAVATTPTVPASPRSTKPATPESSASATAPTPMPDKVATPRAPVANASKLPQAVTDPSPHSTGTDRPTLFLTSATRSESWFAANKYILAVLLVVAIVIAAFAFLR